MNQPFQAILFDLDGTLVDSLPGITWAARLALAEVLPGTELPDLRPFLGPAVREVLRRALGMEDSDRLTALEVTFRRYYNSEGWMRGNAYAGVPETLATLHAAGLRLGVVTNKPQAPTLNILAHLKLARFMEIVTTPDSVAPAYGSKAESLAATLTARSLDPAITLFVGDSDDDAAAAAACGTPFAAAAYGYGNAARQTEHPIHVKLDFIGLLLASPLCF